MKVRQLRPSDTRAALMLLNSDPATNLYQIDVLLRNPLPAFNLYEWRGVFVNQELIAISLSAARLKPNTPSSLCVPFGDLDGCRLLGEANPRWGAQKPWAPKTPLTCSMTASVNPKPLCGPMSSSMCASSRVSTSLI